MFLYRDIYREYIYIYILIYIYIYIYIYINMDVVDFFVTFWILGGIINKFLGLKNDISKNYVPKRQSSGLWRHYQ